MSQKNMNQKNMSQIIVYRSQEELRTKIIKMEEEVKDIERLIEEMEKEWITHFGNLAIDGARSVTASVRLGRNGAYDVSEKSKNYLNILKTDIKNKREEAAAIRMSIKEMRRDLENFKKAAKSDPLKNNRVIYTRYINNNIGNDTFNMNDLYSSIKVVIDEYVAARRASSAKSSAKSSSASGSSSSASGSSSSASGSSSAKSPTAARSASLTAARTASRQAAIRKSSPATRASSPSSNTYRLRKRRRKSR
jgi:hypothetical protein